MNISGKVLNESLIKENESDLSKVCNENLKKADNLQLISVGQKAMYFLHQMRPTSSAYNLKFAGTVKEDISADILKKSIQIIVQRYPILRSVYKEKNGKIQKTILSVSDSHSFHFEQIDAKLFSKEALNQCFIDKCEEPFDIEKGPLIKGYLINKTEKEHIFILVIHHINSDFPSFNLILKELGILYTQIKNGREIELLVPELDFSDFVKSETMFSQSKIMNNLHEYWMNKLSGELSDINLLVDKQRTKKTTQEGKTFAFTINKELSEKLEKLASDCGVTPYTLFMTFYYLLLYRYTGQKDIVIGSPVTMRNKKSFQDTVGYLVNMVPYRFNFENNLKFFEVLSKVNSVILGGLKNRKYPLSSLIAELQPKREISRPPIFQVSFTMEKTSDKSTEGLTKFYLGGTDTKLKYGELEFEAIDFDCCAFPYELSLFAEKVGEEYCAWFVYQTDLFYRSTIQQIANHFVNILIEVTENPQKSIDQYQIISVEERKKVLNVWNNRSILYPKSFCIHQMIEKQAKDNPEAIAVSFEKMNLTYGELNRKSNCLAHLLRRNGVRPGVMVPICFDPCIEMMIGILGILKAGGTYVPFHPGYPQDRICWMLEEIEPIFIISESKFMNRFSTCTAKKLYLDEQWELLDEKDSENMENISSPNDIAYIIYTSGSTGKPKGVMVSHYNVIRLFQATDDWYNFGRSDVWTLFHSFAFDFSVWEIFGSFLYGGRLVIVPYCISRSPEDFYRLLSKEKVTVLNQTPSAFKQLVRADGKLYREHQLFLRYVIFGGEALELKNLKPWIERHGDKEPMLINMYGITETTVHVTYRPITSEDIKNASGSMIGKPIPDLQVYILDENKNIVPNGCCGEMYIGGAGVTHGYFKRSDLTKSKFIQDFISKDEGRKLYRSGDLARFLQNGDIEYLGRIDHQVKIRGFRIELGDIESKILDFFGVSETIVTVKENETNDKRLVAYIVMKDGQQLDVEKLRNNLRSQLPDYMLPAAFIELDAIPITSNGKVDKKALLEASEIGVSEAAGYVSPSTELEKSIADIWKDVLCIKNIGIENNFFDIGGNSMLIVELHSIIQEKIYRNIKVVDLFQYPTIKEFVKFIEDKSTMADVEKDKIEDRGELRLQARLNRKNRKSIC